MRLFVAITPPDVVLDELETRLAPLRPAWPGLRWASRDTWHITLAFLGEVSETAAAALEPRLQRAAHRHQGQVLSLGGAGAFPRRARAQVLWAGIRADQPGLAKLAASIAAGARRAGAPSPDEGRGFTAHLTLARSKAPADLRPLVTSLDDFAGTPWTAAQIHLIRSRLHGIPRHEITASWPLRC
jgi:2'-5' RNA ligase